MIEVTDEMLALLHDYQMGAYGEIDDDCDKRMIAALIELHEQSKPKPEPVDLHDGWIPCVKLPVIVHVRNQKEGETHVSTREGITPVQKDDLIMRGVSGEEYPIGKDIFSATYTFNTTPPTQEPLSEDFLMNIAEECTTQFFNGVHQNATIHFARAIEQAHGIGSTND